MRRRPRSLVKEIKRDGDFSWMSQVSKEQGFLNNREGFLPESSLENEKSTTQVTGPGELGSLHLVGNKVRRVKH